MTRLLTSSWILLVALLLAPVAAEEWTAPQDFEWSQAFPVQLRGRNLTLVWRDGHPYGRTSELSGPLRIASQKEYVDLVLALSKRGRRVRLLNGVVEIESRQKVTATQSQRRYFGPIPTQADAEELSDPFEVKVETCEADATAVRARVMLTNVAHYSTLPRLVTCYISDSEGHVVARDELVLPELKPQDGRTLVFYHLHRGKLIDPGQSLKATVRFARYRGKESEPSTAKKQLYWDKRKKTYSTEARSWRKH